MTAQDWINHLQLQAHPEGGYYRETYRCAETIQAQASGELRHISTAIYFLLENDQKSHLHRIKSDELWFYHQGAVLELFILTDTSITTLELGPDISLGQQLQATVPAGAWFGSRVKGSQGYVLVSCTVAPGFDFRDFELAKACELLNSYPVAMHSLLKEMCLTE